VSPPEFPDLKPVSLEDQAIFDEYLGRAAFGACEMNFANIFIWRGSEHPRWTLLNGNLCVLVEPDFEPPYFLPPAGGADLERTAEACLTIAPRLSRVPEELARSLAASFRVQEDPGNFDYIYRVEDLAGLKGKRYDGKRNRIKRFERSFEHAYAPLEEKHLDGCRRLLLRWSGEKSDADPGIRGKTDAIYEALVRYRDLGLKGAVVTVGGEVAAFAMGTALTSDTALVNVEIADPDMPGLAQWINREFVRREWAGFAFVNREQDMGIEGLRRAKVSYYPHRMLKKFNVTRRA
jgi:uncharacterized protein